ncbi:MAG: hypothetical protein RIC55_21985 [Pirellulaceae bacterium]
MNWREYAPRDVPDSEDKKLAKLIDEMQARITWGEDPEEIRKWALTQDVEATARQIDEALAEAIRRRSAAMRRGGRRDLLIGAAFFLPGGGLAAWMGYEISVGVFHGIAVGRVPSVLAYVLLLISAAAAVFGGWLLLRGLDRVIFGHRAGGVDA